ncbi:hypothetical protein [Okeania sp. SIO1I7]|nr:hypothetical protein [Okeania sp. SIO1I7]
MSDNQLICPSCGSNYIVKNGMIHFGKTKISVSKLSVTICGK